MKEEISQLYDTLRRIGSHFILWYSGGRDSRLLLESSIKVGIRPLLLCLDAGWTREQKTYVYSTVRKHGLPLYSYSPWKSAVCRGKDGSIFTISLYSYTPQGHSFVVIKDLAFTPNRCGLDINFRITDRLSPPIRSMKHVVGTRKTDRHPILEDGEPLVSGPEWEHGGVSFYAPLYDWGTSKVIKALKILKADWRKPSIDTGNIPACHNCLKAPAGKMVYCPKAKKEIPAIAWDGDKNLQIVRSFLKQGGADANTNH